MIFSCLIVVNQYLDHAIPDLSFAACSFARTFSCGLSIDLLSRDHTPRFDCRRNLSNHKVKMQTPLFDYGREISQQRRPRVCSRIA
jgi:hypothetical protein